MVEIGRNNRDAFGQMLLAQLERREDLSEIIERDDNYIDTGSEPGLYFTDYKRWSASEKRAINYASGRILDIGCGAGRHSLYLQKKGFDVTGIDSSPGAIKVCRRRGLKKALVRPIEEISKFKPASFDTVIMLGNNFGLFGSPEKARAILKKLLRITSPKALIIAGTVNPYVTDSPDHLRYHRFNKKRGRMPGQITMRARFAASIGDWFDYLLVSPQEMEAILEGTGWRVEKFLGEKDRNYFAIIRKKKS